MRRSGGLLSLGGLRRGAVIDWKEGVVTELDDTDEEPSHGGSTLIRESLSSGSVSSLVTVFALDRNCN